LAKGREIKSITIVLVDELSIVELLFVVDKSVKELFDRFFLKLLILNFEIEKFLEPGFNVTFPCIILFSHGVINTCCKVIIMIDL
jgi:hypothetical protein